MKELIALIIIAIIGAFGWAYYFLNHGSKEEENTAIVDNIPGELIEEPITEENKPPEIVTPKKDNLPMEIISPLDRAKERVTKKPFGIYITRENSPVQPERFSGYHAGTDFEIFPNELNIDVPVKSICAGKILKKETINGYGGVLINSCTLDNEVVTIVYGHLNLESISKKVGDNLLAGEVIGNLGKNKSSETDGERKHLHLGIHKGSSVSYSGYVFSKNNLESWIDACKYFCK
jgi:murein DD-endopeptidase MepM/ murein hydrolase activator NlpD